MKLNSHRVLKSFMSKTAITAAVAKLSSINILTPKPKVAIAMSGGIDSAATAMILQSRGFDCIGVFMRNWDSQDEAGNETCPINEDLKDMQEVCRRLDIPSFEVEFVRDYWIDVFEPFIAAYQSGVLTPNPDIMCNRFIKFNKFRDYVFKKFDVDYFATGHYVRLIDSNSEIPELKCGIDDNKDQSYFLCMTPGASLKKLLCPVGHMTKSAVRDLVSQKLKDLKVLTKRESTGLCFIGERDMSSFLQNYINFTKGNFVDIQTNAILGEHRGKELYTIGQKAKIKNQKDKYYVVKKDSCSSNVYVALGASNPALYTDQVFLKLDEFVWISGILPSEEILASGELSAKVRYRDPMVPCKLRMISVKLLDVKFNFPIIQVAPGQVVAIYYKDICLGGGIVYENS